MDYDTIVSDKKFMDITIRTSKILKNISRGYAKELNKFGSFVHTWETLYLDMLEYMWDTFIKSPTIKDSTFIGRGRCYMRDVVRSEKARKIRERDYSREKYGDKI